MIPAPPGNPVGGPENPPEARISARPRKPRPAPSPRPGGLALRLPSRRPRPEPSVPAASPCAFRPGGPALRLPPRDPARVPRPESPCAQFAPRLTTQTSPTLPPRHKRFRSATPQEIPPSAPVQPAPGPSAVAHRRLHVCPIVRTMLTSAPSRRNLMGTCRSKVSSRGGVVAGVSGGGREDDAADGTSQGRGWSSGAPVARRPSSAPPDGIGRRP